MIGYEATLADVAFSIKTMDTFGVKCKFKGYNHKLAEFVSVFVKLFAELSSGMVENYLISNAIEQVSKQYINQNVEIDSRTSNNRLIFMIDE